MLRSVIIGLFSLSVLGCGGVVGEDPGSSDGTTLRVSVESPGMPVNEGSTTLVLPVLYGLAGESGVVGAARKGQALIYVQGDLDSIRAKVEKTRESLTSSVTHVEVVEVSALPPRELSIVLDQPKAVKLGVDWDAVVAAVETTGADGKALDVETLKKAVVGQAAAGPILLEHVAELEIVDPTQRTEWDTVVMVVGSTLPNVQHRLSRLQDSLGDAESTQVPLMREQLEVRLTQEALMQQTVHFPEVQMALLPFSDRVRRFEETDPPVALRQRPRALSEARQAEVVSHARGTRLRIASVADLEIRERPEAMIRLPGGAFVGFLLVRGMSSSEVAVHSWQQGVRPALVESWGDVPGASTALLRDVLTRRVTN